MSEQNEQKVTGSDLNTWLGESIHKIGAELPEGYTLQLGIGRGRASIELILDATGESVDFHGNGNFYANLQKAFAFAVLHHAVDEGFKSESA